MNMIVTKEIKFKLPRRESDKNRYKNLGYRCDTEFIMLDIKYIPSSHYKTIIECVCDICGKLIHIQYGSYIQNFNRNSEYHCKSCSELFRIKTNIDRYGVSSPIERSEILNKKRNTCLDKYGYESYSMTSEFKENCNLYENMKNYYKTNFDVDNPMKIYEIYEKQRKSSLKIKKYNDRLYYQGSYELDFICLCEKLKIIDRVANCKEGLLYNEDKYYYPDFIFDDIYIEIKSKYTHNLHKEINLDKINMMNDSGYSFIYILDKDYSNFLKLLN